MPSKSPSRHSTYNSRGHRKIASRGKKCAASEEEGCYEVVQDVETMPAMSLDLQDGILEGARRMGEKKEKFDKDYANVCYIFKDSDLDQKYELVGPSIGQSSERLKAKDEYELRTNIDNHWTDVYENSNEETMPQFCYLKEGNNIKKAHLRYYPGEGYFVSGETAWFGGKKRKTKKQKKSKKQRKTKKQKKSKKARK